MRNTIVQFVLIAFILTTILCPCLAQNYRYSFEGNFGGWAADACDDMPGPNWHIILTQAMHYSGSWSLELYLANYNDATKIWIEKPFLVDAAGTYDVRVRWAFASSDWGQANLFNIIASVSGKNPETMSDFTVIGNTGNGDVHGYVWLAKEYLKKGVRPAATDSSGVGAIWVAFGVWGTWETPRTYYADYTLVDITPLPPTQTVSVGTARDLRDGSVVRIENRPVSSGTSDLAGRIHVEETDRSSGIAVDPAGASSQYPRNKRLVVQGVLETIDGERMIRNASVSSSALPDFAIEPLFAGNREIGGEAKGSYTPGVAGSPGLNNVGLLLTTCGRVVQQGTGFFVVSDGGRQSPCGKSSVRGIAVSTTGLAGGGSIPMPALNSYAVVTGIASTYSDPQSVIYPLLRPRTSADVKTYF